MVPTYAKFDAIGHSIADIQARIRSKGLQSEVFYEHEHGTTAQCSRSGKEFTYDPKSLGVIYHHSVGSKWPLWLLERQPHNLVTLYHNVTPPEYFALAGDNLAEASCRDGIRQLDLLKVISSHAWADSSYNAAELADVGFRKVQVLPLLRQYDRLTAMGSDANLANRLNDERQNLLFVGRIVPSKCQHDLIWLAAKLKKMGHKIRLIMPGGASPPYMERLKNYVSQLGLSVSYNIKESNVDVDILFPGQVTDLALATFYRTAHVFMSASEHEGFCVPIVEAMFFGLPIVAHPMGAVPDTLGTAGKLVNKLEEEEMLAEVSHLLSDSQYHMRAKQMSYEGINRFNSDQLDKEFESVFTKSFVDKGVWGNMKQRFSFNPDLVRL